MSQVRPRTILGIETSCDDTSLCLMRATSDVPEILFLKTYSQTELLNKWGGVVPEIAAREHVEAITHLLSETIQDKTLPMDEITEIAVTTAPGLLGPLLTGINAAKTIALVRELPITPVNHLYAHLEAVHLTEKVPYPYLGLLVSGGHTLLYWVSSSTEFKLLGQSLDDASGEAFDKGGKMLGLGYPAGALIDERAKKGNPKAHDFPVSLLKDRPGKMSFSGLKTSLRYFIEKHPEILKDEQKLNDVCAAYQNSIVRTLVLKTQEVVTEILHQKLSSFTTPIVVGGGVACNSQLRSEMKKHFKNVFIVAPKFCTDNGAMIANQAMRTQTLTMSFPDCLVLEGQSKVVEKKYE